MTRYLIEYIDPQTGRVRLGTQGRFFRDYVSDRNMFRYAPMHLRHASMPAGQYQVTVRDGRVVGHLYKMA